jgi:hypothetical protein
LLFCHQDASFSTIHRPRTPGSIFEAVLKSEAVLSINERAGRMVLMHYEHLTGIIKKEDHRDFPHQANDLTYTDACCRLSNAEAPGL